MLQEMTRGGFRTRGGGLVQALDGAAFRLVPFFAGKRSEAAIDVQLVTAERVVVFREVVRCGSMKRRNALLDTWEREAPRLCSWRDGTFSEPEGETCDCHKGDECPEVQA